MVDMIDSLAEKLLLHPSTIQAIAGRRIKDLPEGSSLEDLKHSMNPVHYNQFMYNLSHVERSQYLFDIVKPHLDDLSKPMSVLDIGCGLGGGLIVFGRKGFKLHGIELNLQSRDMCLKNLEYNELSAEITTEDLCIDDLGGRKFDVIICNSVIEHVIDPEAMIKRFGDLLNRNGVLVLGVANCEALGNIISDPHYQLFGLTIMDRLHSERLYNYTTGQKQSYSVTEWRSIPEYVSLIERSVGPVSLVPPSGEKRGLDAVPGLLIRVLTAYEQAISNPRVKLDQELSSVLTKAFFDFVARVSTRYKHALDGESEVFINRHIRKSFQIIAKF